MDQRSDQNQHAEILPRTDCLLPAQGLFITLEPDKSLRGKGGELIERRIAPGLRINDGGAVRDAACAGLGVALMATWCAADELRSGALVPALPEYPLVSTQTLWVLYPSSRELAPKVRVFIDWLVERFGGQPYWDRGLESILGNSQ